MMSESSKTGELERETAQEQNVMKAEESLLLTRSIELSGLKSRLISVMSHDLRTPLTGILTSAEIIGLNPRFEGDPALMKYSKRIIRSVKSIDLMIKNISAVDKATRGGITRHDQKFHITDLIEEVAENAGMLLSEGAVFNISLLTGEEKTFTGDKTLIRDILEILIDNAVRFGGENCEVGFTVEKQNDELKFTVSDNGHGISGEDTGELFRLFGKGRFAGHAQGTGLGLYVARHLAEVLGGSVMLTRNEPVGCLAVLTVPV